MGQVNYFILPPYIEKVNLSIFQHLSALPFTVPAATVYPEMYNIYKIHNAVLDVRVPVNMPALIQRHFGCGHLIQFCFSKEGLDHIG